MLNDGLWHTQAMAEVAVEQFQAVMSACQLETPPVVTVALLSMIVARYGSGVGGLARSCFTLYPPTDSPKMVTV